MTAQLADYSEGDHLRDLAALDGARAAGATDAEAVRVVAAMLTREAAEVGFSLPAPDLLTYLERLLHYRSVRETPFEHLLCASPRAEWAEYQLSAVRALMADGASEGEAVERVAMEITVDAAVRGIHLDTSRETVADVLRRMLAGPDTCYACGSRVAMHYLCAVCELERLPDHTSDAGECS